MAKVVLSGELRHASIDCCLTQQIHMDTRAWLGLYSVDDVDDQGMQVW